MLSGYMTLSTRATAVALGVLAVAGSGCFEQDMANEGRLKPLEASEFFEDGMTARQPVEGTVARGQLFNDDHLYRGMVDGALAETFPFEVTADVLERGRERYEIFCTPCHDQIGTGNGIVVQRGFRRPSSFHVDALRAAPAGHFYDVMTNGFGTMPSYAAQVPVEDRWAIVAYIRALQLAQNATDADLGPQDLEQLGERR